MTMLRVEVVMAWPQSYACKTVAVAEGACVRDAVAAAGLEDGGVVVAYAIHGVVAKPDQALREGDRIELLRPLLADPKENRRRRARGGE